MLGEKAESEHPEIIKTLGANTINTLHKNIYSLRKSEYFPKYFFSLLGIFDILRNNLAFLGKNVFHNMCPWRLYYKLSVKKSIQYTAM